MYRRSTSWKMPPSPPQKMDIFEMECKKYHTIVFIIFGILFSQWSWLGKISFFVSFECTNSPDLNPCSPECHNITYTKPYIELINFNKRFEWSCNSNWEVLDLSAKFGELVGYLLAFFAQIFKFRRRASLISTLIVGIIAQPLFFLPDELGIFIWTFFDKVVNHFIKIQSFIFLMEISPRKTYTTASVLFFTMMEIGEFVFWRILKISASWTVTWTFHIGLMAVTCALIITKVYESYKLFFEQGQIENCIQVLEKMWKVNGEDPSGVRKSVEKAWRDTRSRPKSEETILGFAKYHFVREITLSVFYTIIIMAIMLEGAGEIKSKYETLLMLAGCSLFLLMERHVGHVKLIQMIILIAAILFVLKARFGNTQAGLFVNISFSILCSMLIIDFWIIIMELYPTNIAPSMVLIFYFIFFLATKVAEYISTMRVAWVANAIFASICFLYFGLTEDIPETKNSKKPLTLRETELFIKQNKKKFL